MHIRDGYDLAARLFSAQFRPNGKPFIAHLIGTASILISHHADVPLVLAGLFHAAYTRGDFGGFWPRVTPGKRQCLRRLIGEESEALVMQYTNFQWDAVVLADSVSMLSESQRRVLYLRLANELEEAIDCDMLYEPGERYQKRIDDLGCCIEIARKLDMLDFAREIGTTHTELHSRKVYTELVSDRPSDYTQLPLSCRKRLMPALSQKLRVVWSKCPDGIRLRARKSAINRVF